MSNNRVYSEYATDEAREHLSALLNAQDDVPAYRQTMHALGQKLGEHIFDELTQLSSVCLVSTAEDADYLTRGLLEVLNRIRTLEVTLVCFWHDRWTIGDEQKISVAPITRRYVEPFDKDHVDAVIVLKSIIASSCVVRTDLTEVLTLTKPEQIFILAPVAYSHSWESLAREFSQEISEKFDYVYFAEDSEMDDEGLLVPGIGGNVYDLLGMPKVEGRSYGPRLIKERRQRYLP